MFEHIYIYMYMKPAENKKKFLFSVDPYKIMYFVKL